MIGECSGKVRSTPTPKETLRTVKVRPTPEPCTRITTPWKTWTRERLPSTTFTWTLMVSPARKAGTSSRFIELPSSAMTLVMSLLASATGQPRCRNGAGGGPVVVAGGVMCPLWQEPTRTPSGTDPRGGPCLADWAEEQVCHSRPVPRKSDLRGWSVAGSAGSAPSGAERPRLPRRPLGHPDDAGLDLAAQAVARLLVDALVAQAARAGEQVVRRGARWGGRLDLCEQ